MTVAVSAPVLSVRGVRLAFGASTILNGVNLDVAAGHSVAIMGRSGSGKSSLLSCILGLVRPDSGAIEIEGINICASRRPVVERIRRSTIGMIFQSGELLPELSPHENVMISGLLAGQSRFNAAERATELLEQLMVPVGARSIAEFSGGERQRVAVARALMNRPRLLLADEPTGSLDPPTRDQVVELIFDMPRRFGCALAVVTHDPYVADQAEQVVELVDGVLHERHPAGASGSS